MTSASAAQPAANTAPLDLTQANALNAILCEAGAVTIKARGVDGSGAFSHYKTMTDEKRLFGAREQDFVTYVADRVGPDHTIHELGDGAGVVSLGLFARGYDCVNLCSNGQRSKFCEKLALGVRAHVTNGRYRILKDRFPSAVTNLLLTREPQAVLISLNSVNKEFADNEGAVVQRATAYSDLIINLARFTRPRDLETEQEELLAMFLRRNQCVVDIQDFARGNRLVWLKRDLG